MCVEQSFYLQKDATFRKSIFLSSYYEGIMRLL
jgi:hypothetical protein